ncbi:CARDB domain-containing protein [Nocardioides litoris]|uniref:CARDB domain-containing protein n=1 Tax=Nocardioides litoris TaxID=1926648 RepID=UPI00111FE96E|nr:CARDB domain-containing protein [Nocardioides litoris]
MTTSSRLSVLLGAGALLLGTLATGVADPAAAARAKPDLVVSSGTVSSRTATVGAPLRMTVTVRNTGSARARSTVTHVDLVGASRTVRLGAPAAPALGRRASQTASLAVRVPAVPAGAYRVRACADARRQVRERREADNCRVVGAVTVVPRSTPPAPQPGPTPPTLPTMDPGDTTIDGFAATSPRLVPAGLVVQQMKADCAQVHPVRPVDLVAAVAAIRARLQRDAPDGVRRLSTSPAYADPLALQELAATGVAEGVPGLALAALLRAAELEPTIATHLVNAAALATTLGLPNEAIALLDAAVGRTARTPALGVPVPVVAATVRGQALVMTGRLEEARRWFTAVRAAAPMLTEADTGLATVEACAGSTARAERLVQRSRVRTHETSTPDQVPTEVDPAAHVDLRAGRATDVRVLPLAQSPAQAVAMHGTYHGVTATYTEELRASEAALDAALARLDEVDADSSLAERVRRASLIELGQTISTPDAARLEQRVEHERSQLDVIWDEFWGGGFEGTFGTIVRDSQVACAGAPGGCEMQYVNDHCRPALAASHRRWVAQMVRLQAAADDQLRDLSLVRSSVAANLAEPAAHAVVVLHIAQLERDLHVMMAGEALRWSTSAASFEAYCVAPLPADLLPIPAATDPASAGPCPPDLARISYKADFEGVYEMKVNCEKVSGEASVEVLPFLYAFAELSADYRAGTVTLMGGSKAKIGGGPLEGSFKSGVYITVDGATGSIKDVGWQVGPEVTASKAGIELSAYKDEMDFSFVSGLKSL